MMRPMRRVLSDGDDIYEIIVDDEGEDMGARPEPSGNRVPRPVIFESESEAELWLVRVADDYSERLALRQVMARAGARTRSASTRPSSCAGWRACSARAG
jgi:hypothetical protein